MELGHFVPLALQGFENAETINTMNGQIITGVGRLLLAVLLMLPLCLYSGERIEIGTQKSKFAPPQDTKLSRDLNKQWGTKLDGDPLNELNLPMNYKNEVWDPRKEKIRKLKEIEDRNWMLMDPGTLSDKEEENFGVADDSEALLKEDESKNWMFSGIVKDPNTKEEPAIGPGRTGHRTKNNAPQTPPPSRDDEEISLRASLNSGTGKEVSKAEGAHMSRELDFRKLFEATSSKDRMPDKGNPDLSEIAFKQGGFGLLGKDKQAMRDEYRNFLSGANSSSDNLGIIAEPKGLTTSPLLIKPGELPSTRPSGLEVFGPPRINDAPLRQDWNVGRVSGFGTLPSPALTPPVSEQPLQPRHTFEAGRARGMNSLGGH